MSSTDARKVNTGSLYFFVSMQNNIHHSWINFIVVKIATSHFFTGIFFFISQQILGTLELVICHYGCKRKRGAILTSPLILYGKHFPGTFCYLKRNFTGKLNQFHQSQLIPLSSWLITWPRDYDFLMVLSRYMALQTYLHSGYYIDITQLKNIQKTVW